MSCNFKIQLQKEVNDVQTNLHHTIDEYSEWEGLNKNNFVLSKGKWQNKTLTSKLSFLTLEALYNLNTSVVRSNRKQSKDCFKVLSSCYIPEYCEVLLKYVLSFLFIPNATALHHTIKIFHYFWALLLSCCLLEFSVWCGSFLPKTSVIQ